MKASGFAELTGMRPHDLDSREECFKDLQDRVENIRMVDMSRFIVSFVGDVDQGKSLLQNEMFGLSLNSGIDASTIKMGVSKVNTFQELPCSVLSLDTPGFPEFSEAAKLSLEFMDCSNLVFILVPYLTFENEIKLRFVSNCIRKCVFMKIEFVILLTRFDECYAECKVRGPLENHLNEKLSNLKQFMERHDPSLLMLLACSGIDIASRLLASSCTNKLKLDDNFKLVCDETIQKQIWEYGVAGPNELRKLVQEHIEARLDQAEAPPARIVKKEEDENILIDD
jgi:hypothetical protein